MANLSSKVGRFWPVFACLAALPSAASAHTVIPGTGEFVNGFAHPLATPSHLFLLICLGLLLGQQRSLQLKLPLSVFALVSALGLFITSSGIWKGESSVILASVSLILGFLVVLAIPVPRWATASIFAVAAMALSLDSMADAAVTPWSVGKTLFGTWISFLVWIVDIGYYVFLLPPQKWIRTGIRVAGSWVVAISFLVLAFVLRH